MGQSTDAILFYGYCWKEEQEAPWETDSDSEEDVDWEGRYAQRKGLGPYPQKASQKARFAYLDKQAKLAKSSGCLVGEHCSNECSMPYVAITESKITASRGCPEIVGGGHLEIKPDWDRQLAEFCKIMEIVPPQEKPQWWLVSYWG